MASQQVRITPPRPEQEVHTPAFQGAALCALDCKGLGKQSFAASPAQGAINKEEIEIINEENL